MQRLLTIHIPALHFQFRFLITNATSEEVNKVLLDLRKKIGIELWKKSFQLCFVIMVQNLMNSSSRI